MIHYLSKTQNCNKCFKCYFYVCYVIRAPLIILSGSLTHHGYFDKEHAGPNEQNRGHNKDMFINL